MSRVARVPARCTGNPSFQPEAIVEDQNRLKESRLLLAEGNLYDAIRVLFGLPERDIYTYHAMTAVKLAEVQRIVSLGGANGLHTWYRGGDGSPVSASPSRWCHGSPKIDGSSSKRRLRSPTLRPT